MHFSIDIRGRPGLIVRVSLQSDSREGRVCSPRSVNV